MVWKEAIDPTSKHLYYYNTATGAHGILRYKSVPPRLYLNGHKQRWMEKSEYGCMNAAGETKWDRPAEMGHAPHASGRTCVFIIRQHDA
jgi:hypothetical protein